MTEPIRPGVLAPMACIKEDYTNCVTETWV